MSEKSRTITTTEGRHRVAYEMALMIWQQSNKTPNTENYKEFLSLVEECTKALAHRDG